MPTVLLWDVRDERCCPKARPSGLRWGCRTTQVEASDAQPEQGGLASISPIHGPRVYTHTRTHPLRCQQTHSHTHAQFAAFTPVSPSAANLFTVLSRVFDCTHGKHKRVSWPLGVYLK